MYDDLSLPLGQALRRPVSVRRPGGVRRLLGSGVAMVLVVGSVATAILQPAYRQADLVAEIAARHAARAEADRKAAARAVPALEPVERAALPDPSRPTVTYPPGNAGMAVQLSVSDPGSARQAPSFADRVEDALIEPSEDGPLPVRAADGRRPFDVYAVAPSSSSGVRIAIVVGGLGISQTGTQAAIAALPSGVTLGFAPAGNSLDRWMKEARRGGHELVLQVPMEPFGYPETSPGADTVTVDDVAAGRFAALRRSLGRMTNYVGVANFMGARLTADQDAMTPFLAELSRRGLLYLDDGSSVRSVARDAARGAGAAHAEADIVLDAEPEGAAILKRLDALERAARANGTAIGTASAFDVSVETIATWIKAAEGRGVRIVPVSALASDPEAR